jgi:hypothetical protein
MKVKGGHPMQKVQQPPEEFLEALESYREASDTASLAEYGLKVVLREEEQEGIQAMERIAGLLLTRP